MLAQSEASEYITLFKNTNQARLLGEFAIDFLQSGNPSQKVINRVKLFHTDSVLCGISALALKTNAPHVLQKEALSKSIDLSNEEPHQGYAKVFGSKKWVPAENAICANISAVREWDSNGTVFGYNPRVPGHQAGEFGHNDFYTVIIAAAQQNKNIDGKLALKAMILLDEIRGRLCEVFSLKSYKIDHVVHGAIASICTYGALLNATAEQIEYAIGMFVAHYIPYRAIRAGHQLSDSKGASAAISTEAAIKCINRTMNGFIGPADVFRNPEAIFRLNEKTSGDCPFNIILTKNGDDFAIMGMHFKLGIYEHQSAGALEGIQKLILEHKFVAGSSLEEVDSIRIISYEPAFGIIGDPAKRDPHTRQSADHSMVYIFATMLRKAFEDKQFHEKLTQMNNLDEVWKGLFLSPFDYGYEALYNKNTRKLIEKVTFEHGGKEYDEKYPEGIPGRVIVKMKDGKEYDSGFMMFPSGHANNKTADLEGILLNKFQNLGQIAIKNEESLKSFITKLNNIENLSNTELLSLYECDIQLADKSIDE